MEDTYEKACTEVIELLKFFPKESVEKIPKEKLEVYLYKMDKTYNYKVDKNKTFEQQKMSEKTKAIFANIFRDYWATDYQRERIKAKEKYDIAQIEKEKYEKYNPNNIFKNKKQEEITEKVEVDNVAMIEYKEPIFKKFINKIKQIFKNMINTT